MDLFSISCTTCKSRLKVREESAIGQILACPKCGGMVMVRPPEGWKKGEPLPTPAPLSSAALPITTVVEVRRPDETLGDSNFDVVDDLLSDAPPKIRTPSSVSVAPDAPGLARPRFVGAPPPTGNGNGTHAAPASGTAIPALPTAPSNLAEHETPRPNPSSLAGEGSTVRGNGATSAPSSATLPAAAAEAPKPPPPGEANVADLPPPDWSPPAPWRYWVMMAGSVVAGIALALAVVVGMIQFFKGDPQITAHIGTSQPAVTPTTSTTPSTATSPAAPAPTRATTPVTPTPTVPAVEATPMPEVGPMPPMPMPPAPAVEQDPIGLTEPPQPEVMPADPNDPLAKFDRLIGGEDVPAAVEEPAAAPAPMPPPSAPAGPEKPVLPRPAPRSVNITARLADPLPGIETSGTPLAEFLQFFQDLSTIPITLEPDGLAFVRATPESPIVLTTEEATRNTTVGAALAAGLRPLGLEYAVADDQLVVRLVRPMALPTRNYPIKDLAADEAQMAELVKALQELIEPESWAAAGGEGTLIADAAQGKLVVSQRWDVQAELTFACEKLRTARKLPYSTGTRYDPAVFQLDTRLARAKARLETPISLNFSQPAPLVRILDYLGKAGGVRILVDWRDIASAGWNPDGEATLIADKQPLATALDALLGPMDLTWRVVDGQTIQVLTPETLAARCELEFYKVDGLTGDDASGETLVAKLQTTLGEALFREAGGPGELRYDALGQCLLASLPQPKQRELELLLAKWRSEVAAE